MLDHHRSRRKGKVGIPPTPPICLSVSRVISAGGSIAPLHAHLKRACLQMVWWGLSYSIRLLNRLLIFKILLLGTKNLITGMVIWTK